MHRPGCDPENMEITDFLCDFCRRQWDGSFPMIEGHKGALICGRCLTVAYTEVVLNEAEGACAGEHCALCLEQRDEPHWTSPVHDDTSACLRCLKQGAGRLHKDKDWEWTKPGV